MELRAKPAQHPPQSCAARLTHSAQATAAQRARAVLDERYLDPLAADELAMAAGCSRFALYRAFRPATASPRASTSDCCGCASPAG